MKIALIKTKTQKPNHHQVYNNNQQREYRETETAERTSRKIWKINIETHLTVSGVCTTVRPEKSGT
jgi:hypothetical protein